MKFTDIVTLAKAGYSPKDVKELLELCETSPEVKEKEIELPKETPEEKEEKDALDAFQKLVEDNKEE